MAQSLQTSVENSRLPDRSYKKFNQVEYKINPNDLLNRLKADALKLNKLTKGKKPKRYELVEKQLDAIEEDYGELGENYLDSVIIPSLSQPWAIPPPPPDNRNNNKFKASYLIYPKNTESNENMNSYIRREQIYKRLYSKKLLELKYASREQYVKIKLVKIAYIAGRYALKLAISYYVCPLLFSIFQSTDFINSDVMISAFSMVLENTTNFQFSTSIYYKILAAKKEFEEIRKDVVGLTWSQYLKFGGQNETIVKLFTEIKKQIPVYPEGDAEQIEYIKKFIINKEETQKTPPSMAGTIWENLPSGSDILPNVFPLVSGDNEEKEDIDVNTILNGNFSSSIEVINSLFSDSPMEGADTIINELKENLKKKGSFTFSSAGQLSYFKKYVLTEESRTKFKHLIGLSEGLIPMMNGTIPGFAWADIGFRGALEVMSDGEVYKEDTILSTLGSSVKKDLNMSLKNTIFGQNFKILIESSPLGFLTVADDQPLKIVQDLLGLTPTNMSRLFLNNLIDTYCNPIRPTKTKLLTQKEKTEKLESIIDRRVELINEGYSFEYIEALLSGRQNEKGYYFKSRVLQILERSPLQYMPSIRDLPKFTIIGGGTLIGISEMLSFPNHARTWFDENTLVGLFSITKASSNLLLHNASAIYRHISVMFIMLNNLTNPIGMVTNIGSFMANFFYSGLMSQGNELFGISKFVLRDNLRKLIMLVFSEFTDFIEDIKKLTTDSIVFLSENYRVCKYIFKNRYIKFIGKLLELITGFLVPLSIQYWQQDYTLFYTRKLMSTTEQEIIEGISYSNFSKGLEMLRLPFGSFGSLMYQWVWKSISNKTPVKVTINKEEQLLKKLATSGDELQKQSLNPNIGQIILNNNLDCKIDFGFSIQILENILPKTTWDEVKKAYCKHKLPDNLDETKTILHTDENTGDVIVINSDLVQSVSEGDKLGWIIYSINDFYENHPVVDRVGWDNWGKSASKNSDNINILTIGNKNNSSFISYLHKLAGDTEIPAPFRKQYQSIIDIFLKNNSAGINFLGRELEKIKARPDLAKLLTTTRPKTEDVLKFIANEQYKKKFEFTYGPELTKTENIQVDDMLIYGKVQIDAKDFECDKFTINNNKNMRDFKDILINILEFNTKFPNNKKKIYIPDSGKCNRSQIIQSLNLSDDESKIVNLFVDDDTLEKYNLFDKGYISLNREEMVKRGWMNSDPVIKTEHFEHVRESELNILYDQVSEYNPSLAADKFSQPLTDSIWGMREHYQPRTIPFLEDSILYNRPGPDYLVDLEYHSVPVIKTARQNIEKHLNNIKKRIDVTKENTYIASKNELKKPFLGAFNRMGFIHMVNEDSSEHFSKKIFSVKDFSKTLKDSVTQTDMADTGLEEYNLPDFALIPTILHTNNRGKFTTKLKNECLRILDVTNWTFKQQTHLNIAQELELRDAIKKYTVRQIFTKMYGVNEGLKVFTSKELYDEEKNKNLQDPILLFTPGAGHGHMKNLDVIQEQMVNDKTFSNFFNRLELSDVVYDSREWVNSFYDNFLVTLGVGTVKGGLNSPEGYVNLESLMSVVHHYYSSDKDNYFSKNIVSIEEDLGKVISDLRILKKQTKFTVEDDIFEQYQLWGREIALCKSGTLDRKCQEISKYKKLVEDITGVFFKDSSVFEEIDTSEVKRNIDSFTELEKEMDKVIEKGKKNIAKLIHEHKEFEKSVKNTAARTRSVPAASSGATISPGAATSSTVTTPPSSGRTSAQTTSTPTQNQGPQKTRSQRQVPPRIQRGQKVTKTQGSVIQLTDKMTQAEKEAFREKLDDLTETLTENFSQEESEKKGLKEMFSSFFDPLETLWSFKGAGTKLDDESPLITPGEILKETINPDEPLIIKNNVDAVCAAAKTSYGIFLNGSMEGVQFSDEILESKLPEINAVYNGVLSLNEVKNIIRTTCLTPSAYLNTVKIFKGPSSLLDMVVSFREGMLESDWYISGFNDLFSGILNSITTAANTGTRNVILGTVGTAIAIYITGGAFGAILAGSGVAASLTSGDALLKTINSIEEFLKKSKLRGIIPFVSQIKNLISTLNPLGDRNTQKRLENGAISEIHNIKSYYKNVFGKKLRTVSSEELFTGGNFYIGDTKMTMTQQGGDLVLKSDKCKVTINKNTDDDNLQELDIKIGSSSECDIDNIMFIPEISLTDTIEQWKKKPNFEKKMIGLMNMFLLISSENLQFVIEGMGNGGKAFSDVQYNRKNAYLSKIFKDDTMLQDVITTLWFEGGPPKVSLPHTPNPTIFDHLQKKHTTIELNAISSSLPNSIKHRQLEKNWKLNRLQSTDYLGTLTKFISGVKTAQNVLSGEENNFLVKKIQTLKEEVENAMIRFNDKLPNNLSGGRDDISIKLQNIFEQFNQTGTDSPGVEQISTMLGDLAKILQNLGKDFKDVNDITEELSKVTKTIEESLKNIFLEIAIKYPSLPLNVFNDGSIIKSLADQIQSHYSSLGDEPDDELFSSKLDKKITDSEKLKELTGIFNSDVFKLGKFTELETRIKKLEKIQTEITDATQLDEAEKSILRNKVRDRLAPSRATVTEKKKLIPDSDDLSTVFDKIRTGVRRFKADLMLIKDWNDYIQTFKSLITKIKSKTSKTDNEQELLTKWKEWINKAPTETSPPPSVEDDDVKKKMVKEVKPEQKISKKLFFKEYLSKNPDLIVDMGITHGDNLEATFTNVLKFINKKYKTVTPGDEFDFKKDEHWEYLGANIITTDKFAMLNAAYNKKVKKYSTISKAFEDMEAFSKTNSFSRHDVERLFMAERSLLVYNRFLKTTSRGNTDYIPENTNTPEEFLSFINNPEDILLTKFYSLKKSKQIVKESRPLKKYICEVLAPNIIKSAPPIQDGLSDSDSYDLLVPASWRTMCPSLGEVVSEETINDEPSYMKNNDNKHVLTLFAEKKQKNEREKIEQFIRKLQSLADDDVMIQQLKTDIKEQYPDICGTGNCENIEEYKNQLQEKISKLEENIYKEIINSYRQGYIEDSSIQNPGSDTIKLLLDAVDDTERKKATNMIGQEMKESMWPPVPITWITPRLHHYKGNDDLTISTATGTPHCDEFLGNGNQTLKKGDIINPFISITEKIKTSSYPNKSEKNPFIQNERTSGWRNMWSSSLTPCMYLKKYLGAKMGAKLKSEDPSVEQILLYRPWVKHLHQVFDEIRVKVLKGEVDLEPSLNIKEVMKRRFSTEVHGIIDNIIYPSTDQGSELEVEDKILSILTELKKNACEWDNENCSPEQKSIEKGLFNMIDFNNQENLREIEGKLEAMEMNIEIKKLRQKSKKFADIPLWENMNYKQKFNYFILTLDWNKDYTKLYEKYGLNTIEAGDKYFKQFQQQRAIRLLKFNRKFGDDILVQTYIEDDVKLNRLSETQQKNIKEILTNVLGYTNIDVDQKILKNTSNFVDNYYKMILGNCDLTIIPQSDLKKKFITESTPNIVNEYLGEEGAKRFVLINQACDKIMGVLSSDPGIRRNYVLNTNVINYRQWAKDTQNIQNWLALSSDMGDETLNSHFFGQSNKLLNLLHTNVSEKLNTVTAGETDEFFDGVDHKLDIINYILKFIDPNIKDDPSTGEPRLLNDESDLLGFYNKETCINEKVRGWFRDSKKRINQEKLFMCCLRKHFENKNPQKKFLDNISLEELLILILKNKKEHGRMVLKETIPDSIIELNLKPMDQVETITPSTSTISPLHLEKSFTELYTNSQKVVIPEQVWNGIFTKINDLPDGYEKDFLSRHVHMIFNKDDRVPNNVYVKNEYDIITHTRKENIKQNVLALVRKLKPLSEEVIVATDGSVTRSDEQTPDIIPYFIYIKDSKLKLLKIDITDTTPTDQTINIIIENNIDTFFGGDTLIGEGQIPLYKKGENWYMFDSSTTPPSYKQINTLTTNNFNFNLPTSTDLISDLSLSIGDPNLIEKFIGLIKLDIFKSLLVHGKGRDIFS